MLLLSGTEPENWIQGTSVMDRTGTLIRGTKRENLLQGTAIRDRNGKLVTGHFS